MFWSKKRTFIDTERAKLGKLTEQDIEAALAMLGTEPIHSYLLSLIDELVRQGIYLSPAEQEGAKMFVKLMGGEMQKASELMKKRDREKRHRAQVAKKVI